MLITDSDLQQEAVELLAAAVAARCEPEVGIYEEEVAGVYADAMERFGLEVETFEEESGRPSVVGRVRGSGGGRALGLNAHLMSPVSELEDWNTPPYDLTVNGDRLYGSGVADAKAGIVAMLFAARHLAEQGSKGDLIVGLGAGGEFGGIIGTKAMVDRGIVPDAVVVCEATHLDLIYRQRGAIFFDVNIRGVTGLTGGGAHANHAALDLAQALRDVVSQIAGRQADAPPDVGPGSVNVNYLKGGTFYYNVPDRCVLYIDRRLALNETPEEAMQQVEDVVKGVGERHPDVQISIEVKTVVPSCETDPDSVLAQELSAVVKEVKGSAPALKGIRGFTEMAHWAAAGADGLVCGPGGLDVIHRPNEYMELSEFMETIDVYAGLAQRFTNLPERSR